MSDEVVVDPVAHAQMSDEALGEALDHLRWAHRYLRVIPFAGEDKRRWVELHNFLGSFDARYKEWPRRNGCEPSRRDLAIPGGDPSL